jgi:hypothetical protein
MRIAAGTIIMIKMNAKMNKVLRQPLDSIIKEANGLKIARPAIEPVERENKALPL